MRENRPSGSVEGAAGDRGPYSDPSPLPIPSSPFPRHDTYLGESFRE